MSCILTEACKYKHCTDCSQYKIAELTTTNNLPELAYTKTYEEEQKEQLMAATAEEYLESLGIKVKTDYGYYRNTWDILKDFGTWLSKNNKYTLPADYLARAVKIDTI